MALYKEPCRAICTCGNKFISMDFVGFAPVKDGCSNCKQRVADEARKAHFASLDALSLEERIRKIEEWVYDYKPPAAPDGAT